MRNRTIIIGCGKLGAAIANHASITGGNVVVVDTNPDAFSRLDQNFSGFPIAADATDPHELVAAGIENANEVVITTGDDNVSLLLTHMCAEKYGVPYIYVRFDDPEKGLLIQGLEGVRAIYPFQLSRARFNLFQGKDEEEGDDE